jgi:hypothetical protein
VPSETQPDKLTPTSESDPSLEAIDQELLETEDAIGLQQKKVALLQVLRREYLSGRR